MTSFRKSAEHPEGPGDDAYLFVLEDLSRPRTIVGVSGISAKVGGFEPFYNYRIDVERFESVQLGVHHQVPTLKLHEDHNGPSEIGSLFLHPDYRHSGNGRLLQLARFLFVAELPDLFEPTVITEIRGVCDEQGNSPFWDAVGRHFFGIDFRRADYLSIVNKRFIAELMPDHPIYIPMLPESARAVIGRPHTQSAKAVANLQNEGFVFGNMVDIFDAGPLYQCRRDDIRTVRLSRRAPIREAEGDPLDQRAIVMTMQPSLRAVACRIRSRTDGSDGSDRTDKSNPSVRSDADVDSVGIDREAIEALGIAVGTSVRFVAFDSGHKP
jgi:arginine N-succinyltransferase